MRALAMYAAIAALLVAGLPAAALANRTGQGNPLSAPANYPYNCDYRWTPGFAGTPGAFGPGGYQDYVPQFINPSTCSVFQLGIAGQPQTSHLVPGTGTVTRARVRSGPNPAPISIATVRLYTGRNQQGNLVTTCCLGVSQTPVVNPTPNGITEIPVNFRVEVQEFDPNVPNRVGFHDIVAVNIHGTEGTLPMHDRGGPKPILAPPDDPNARWYFPKFDPSVNNQNAWVANGFEVLMNYDWCPAAGASARVSAACATPPPPPPPQSTPPVSVRSSSLTLRGSSVGVALRCTAARACAATVRLRTRARRSRLLASRRVRLPARRTSTVSLSLSRAARALVGRNGLRVRVEVDMGTAGRATRDLTLRRATR